MAQPTNEIEFYPSGEYLSKNWAGTKVPLESLRALARSQAIAEHHGLLDTETTKYYLPSALTEGRWTDYGVNQVAINQRNAPSGDWMTVQQARDAAITQAYKQGKMTKDQYLGGYKKYNYAPEDKVPGLQQLNQLMNSEELWSSENVPDRVRKVRAAANKLGFPEYSTEIRPAEKGYGKYDMYLPVADQGPGYEFKTEDYHKNAALKTLALVNKVDETGKSGLDLWEKYNGSGPDAKRYKRRVSEAYDMMTHPKNRDMWNAYNNMVKQYKLEMQNGKR